MKIGSLCALGQTAPNPVLSSLHYFPKEYEAHIQDKKCPKKPHKINGNVCIKCGVCKDTCKFSAIEIH